MSDWRTAAQQALEALDCLEAPPTGAINHYELERRKNALRAALAQPADVSADSKNPRDKDDVPLERAVLVREWKAMRLALSTPRSNPYVPQGWVLVPVEPTHEMCDQGAQAIVQWENGCVWPDSWGDTYAKQYRKDAKKAYSAMLAAAPKGSTK